VIKYYQLANFLPFNQENTAELCKLFENNKDNSLLIGDFNFPGINWFELTFDRGSEQFLNCTIYNNFEQLISFPTHLRRNTLDLLFSKNLKIYYTLNRSETYQPVIIQ